jgi:hypothetical protein
VTVGRSGRRSGGFVGALGQRPLHALAVAVDQDVAEVGGIVVDVDPAAAQVGLDHERDALDLDGHRLGVDLAAHADAEGLGDEDGIGITRGEVGLGEPIQRRLVGDLVHREVVALLEPGLEASWISRRSVSRRARISGSNCSTTVRFQRSMAPRPSLT